MRARGGAPDLIILDLMMPGVDGYRILRTLREEGRKTPVLILSARGEEADKVRGFRHGADDYVTKPFSLLELIARVEALLRRAAQPDDGKPGLFRFGDVTVDTNRHVVTRGGVTVELTNREFLLLTALIRRDGDVLPRRELLQEVWGYPGTILTRTVDSHISELRRKLEPDPARPRHILTVRKIGYRLRV